MYQNLWNIAKAVLRRKLKTLIACIRNKDSSEISSVSLYLKKLRKEDENKPKASRRKGIICVRAEIKEIENMETE